MLLQDIKSIPLAQQPCCCAASAWKCSLSVCTVCTSSHEQRNSGSSSRGPAQFEAEDLANGGLLEIQGLMGSGQGNAKQGSRGLDARAGLPATRCGV